MKVIILSVLFSLAAMAENNPGSALLGYFSATCTSQGNWTQLALNDARNLMSTIATIRDDEDCKSVAGSLAQLGVLENKLSNIYQNYGHEIEIASLEAQEIEILSQLSSITDSSVRADLEDTLRSIQIEKASLVAMEDQYNEYNGGKLRNMYSALVTNTAAVYKTITNNQLCLNNNPGLLSSATALSTSIAASSALVNPALSIGLASVTDFIGNTVEYFRSRGYNLSIRNVANGSTILEGLKCAMESLTNRWCDIQEAEAFLDFEANKNNDKKANSDLNIISDIYDTDIPVLLDWLTRVKAGAPAANSADAQRRRSIIFRRAMVEASIFLGQGVFSEKRPLFDQSKDYDGKFSVLRSAINSILNEVPEGRSSILTDIVSYKLLPFYLLGFDEIPRRGGSTMLASWDSYNPKIDTPNYVPDFQKMESRFATWMQLAQDRVTQEYSLVSQPDPLQILSTYSEKTSNIWKKAPEEAVQNIIGFIKQNKPDDLDSRFSELYDSTVFKLENIDNAVFGEFSLTNDCEEPQRVLDLDGFALKQDFDVTNQSFNVGECNKLLKAIEIIFKEANLENGVIVFQNRLEIIIRVAIDKYIKMAEEKDQEHIATLLASNSYLDALKNISGTDNYAQIKFDLQKAKPIALNNMSSFVDFFGYTMNQLFYRNQNMVNHSDPTISQTYRDDRAHMCFLISAMPQWPHKVFKRYCLGMQLESMQSGGPSTPVITQEYLNKPFKERSCVYRNYLKRSKIYQDWGINISN